MNTQLDLAETTAINLGSGGVVCQAIKERGDTFLMTQQAEEAVLRPSQPGAWPADLRIALAARIAALNELQDLAGYYKAMSSSEHYSEVAEPANSGASLGLAHVVTYMDSVAQLPRDIKIEDVRELQRHGVNDADVVRLTELNAFMAYQVRLVSGLALMNTQSS